MVLWRPSWPSRARLRPARRDRYARAQQAVQETVMTASRGTLIGFSKSYKPQETSLCTQNQPEKVSPLPFLR